MDRLSRYLRLWLNTSTKRRAVSEPEMPKPAPAPFQYEPLSTEPHQIRLLRLNQPVDYEGPISLSLENVTVSEASKLEYRALSYTWGEPTLECTVLVNGVAFAVRLNLFTFLSDHRRSGNGAVPIWIDQICINQNDVAERNSQVQKMGIVYSHAEEVIIWLGTSTPEYAYVLDMIHHKWLRRRKGQIERINALEVAALHGFLEIPWFQRLWIVQEVVLAKSLSIRTSGRLMSWDAIATVYEIYTFRGQNLELKKWNHEPTTMERLVTARRLYRSARQPRLFDYINAFHSFGCADPRDTIYALLGLLDEEETQHFPVQYQLPPKALYVSLCVYTLIDLESNYRFKNQNYDTRVITMLIRLGRSMGFQDALHHERSAEEIQHFLCTDLPKTDVSRRTVEYIDKWRLVGTYKLGKVFRDAIQSLTNFPSQGSWPKLSETYQKIMMMNKCAEANAACSSQLL